MRASQDADFWSSFAKGYDGHVASREALVLIPSIVATLGQRTHVLDLGCGTGEVALAVAANSGRVSAVDFAAGMVELTRRKAAARNIENIDASVQEADALPFPDGTFDAVVMANVLHVMEHPDQALREAARVLRPQGLLVAPTYCHGQNLKARLLSRVSVLLFGLRVHNRWSGAELLAKLDGAGFVVGRHEMLQFRMPLIYVEALRKQAL